MSETLRGEPDRSEAERRWQSSASIDRVPAPSALAESIPLGRHAAAVHRARDAVRLVLSGADDRLLVIAGPCSVHDPSAAQEYACWLAEQGAEFGDDLLLVMRAYVEKPRTAGGWRGLVADPWLDGSCDMVAGLEAARALLIELAVLGVPAATEWLDPRVVPYLEDCVTFGMIGARTTQSQPHRQLASGLPMPVGFKNACDGDVQSAIDGCRVAAGQHVYLGMSPWDGGPSLMRSAGNPDCCVVLRGGRQGPNYRRVHVRDALARAGAAGLPRRVLIDASHGNSGKDPRRQPEVALAVTAQVAAGERGIRGMMLESFLVAGRQEPGPLVSLTYGQSVTDACIGASATRPVLETLTEAVRARRAVAAR